MRSENKPPFKRLTLEKIAQLRRVYGFDLVAADSHRLREQDGGSGADVTTFLLAFGALFSIVNPMSGAFIFFGATRDLDPRVRAQVARWVAIYAFCIVDRIAVCRRLCLEFFRHLHPGAARGGRHRRRHVRLAEC